MFTPVFPVYGSGKKHCDLAFFEKLSTNNVNTKFIYVVFVLLIILKEKSTSNISFLL